MQFFKPLALHVFNCCLPTVKLPFKGGFWACDHKIIKLYCDPLSLKI